MPSTLLASPAPTLVTPSRRRSIQQFLAPLDRLVASSTHLVANPGAQFEVEGETYELPRYVFLGPRGGGDPIRIGLFAAIHGDEPEGAYALRQFITLLDRCPELASGFHLSVYPICNPTGFEDNTRASRGGWDLNREFWNRSPEPEVQLLERELSTQSFQGLISLHTDDTSDGLYGCVRGATLTQHLLEPALRAASDLLPRNLRGVIDGFKARNSIIRTGTRGC